MSRIPLLAAAVLAAVALVVPASMATTAQSDLTLGGITVAHASFSSTGNTFDVYDDYPDHQSAAARYRVGRSTKTYTAWASKGEGTHRVTRIAGGGLPVKFRACRADRDGATQFQCAKHWKTLSSRCLKASWKAVRSRAGACLSYSGQVQHTGAGPYERWGFRVYGQISAPGAGKKPARLQVRTHVAGAKWGHPVTVVKVAHGLRKRFDQVVDSGGRPFFQQYRLCGKTCGGWTNGDGTVGY